MEGVRGCPYCHGEVEVVKLIKRKEEKLQPYRIECRHCHRLVARGQGFPIETITEAQERIKDYEAYMARVWSPMSSTKIRQSDNARKRDRRASMASRISKDDEVYDMHDASNRHGHRVSRGGVGDWDL